MTRKGLPEMICFFAHGIGAKRTSLHPMAPPRIYGAASDLWRRLGFMAPPRI